MQHSIKLSQLGNNNSLYKWVKVEEIKEITDLFPPSKKVIEVFIHELF
ncbi:hypothetical protein [Geosporobacter ferrireducens]|nr:hypothetical protein [Geosporobacter ferrireducens]